MQSRNLTVALVLVAMTASARAENKGSYRLEGDEDGKPVVVALSVEGDRARHAIGDRIWEGTAKREGEKILLRFEVPLAGSTVGVTGALSAEHGGGAGEKNVFTGTLVADRDGA